MLLDPRWIPLNVGVLTKKSFWICSLGLDCSGPVTGWSCLPLIRCFRLQATTHRSRG